ncbi:hypothetical protein [Agrococcus jejuensis]|uniref:Uncharacterized protein n=1 Tax=Agrococcus jejuensis TaxID=399736 RepID=A0A1G8D305_9MICO|nr:hypothetical protein [Agrococcus jejuensis]SDH51769.1 hypothetical protein SAMN04489720_1489 [Agrococcus jejuensis]
MSDPTAPPQDPVPQPAAAQPPAQPMPVPAGRRQPLRILGIQPVLLVGMVLLVLVTLLTIVLVFVGDIGTQAPRVVWTVIAFVAFTGLLALDLSLSRRSSVPLVIGVCANVYLLAVLMLATWVQPIVVTPPDVICDPIDGCDYADPYRYGPPLGIALLGVFLLAFFVVRAAAAGAWALVALGRRGAIALARVMGVVAAALLGLAAVLLTLHLAITPFGVRIGDLYWRFAVAAVVLAALAACITTLLYWNRRQLDAPPPAPAPAPAAPQPALGEPVQPAQAWMPHPGAVPPPGYQPWPGQPMPPQQWQGQPMPGQPMPGQPWPYAWPTDQQVPNPMAPPPGQSPQQGPPPPQ